MYGPRAFAAMCSCVCSVFTRAGRHVDHLSRHLWGCCWVDLPASTAASWYPVQGVSGADARLQLLPVSLTQQMIVLP